MEVTTFPIMGLKLINLKTFHDARGFFTERFNREIFKELDLQTDFVQDNFSRSNYGVLRGLHYQSSPPQGKLVSCTSGEIFDVAVDLRKDSPTYGMHQSIILNCKQPSLFWIPSGFAHGFCVISPNGADVLYKVTSMWNGASERCISWSDPSLNIAWPIENPILSDKDRLGGPL